MKKFVLLTVSIMTFSTAVMAKDVVISVNGMVCDFCAQSLKKVFLKEDGVDSLDISLEDKTVTVHTTENGDISNDKIRELINWAGYETVDIKR